MEELFKEHLDDNDDDNDDNNDEDNDPYGGGEGLRKARKDWRDRIIKKGDNK